MRSLRSRLVFWNLLVVALFSGLFGWILVSEAHRRGLEAIDRDLRFRARAAARVPDPPPFAGRGEGFGMGPGFGRGRGPRGGGPPGPPPPDGPDGPEPRTPPIDDPLFRFRRAIFLDPQGQGVRPPGEQPFDPEGFRQAAAGREAFTSIVAEDQSLRVFSVPWPRSGGGPPGVVQVARETRDVDSVSRSLAQAFAVLFPVALVLAGLGARFLADRALIPVAKVTRAAAAVRGENMSRRLAVDGNDELAELQRTFNEMLDRLDGAFGQLKESVENQRRFTADASHELRTPLTKILLAASGAKEPGANPMEAAHTVEVAARQMQTLVDQLLLLSRADSGQLALSLERLDLRVLVAEAVDELPDASARVAATFPEEAVFVLGDFDHLRRCFRNLVENALRYSAPDSQVRVQVTCQADQAQVSVEDHGIGIGAADLLRLGERFFRANPARTHGEGTGLGLAIAKTIVQAHQGRLEFQSAEGKGTTVEVFLPAS